MSLFADDMMLYIENPRDVTKKILELTNGFGKVAEYIINIKKSVVFLYIKNKLSEREIKKIIPCTITSMRVKHLRINRTITSLVLRKL